MLKINVKISYKTNTMNEFKTIDLKEFEKFYCDLNQFQGQWIVFTEQTKAV